MRPSLWTAVLGLSLLTACAGASIREDATRRQAQLSAPLPPPGPLALDTPGPYQVGVRISEVVLSQLLKEVLTEEVEAAFTTSSGEEIMGFTPTLRATGTHLSIGGCPRCINLEVRFVAELKVKPGGWFSSLMAKAAEYLRTDGKVKITGRLATVRRNNQPALTVRDLSVGEIKLDGLISTEFTNPREALEDVINDGFHVTLADTRSDGPSIPLPGELAIGEESLTLTAVGVDTVPGSKTSPGEVFVGFSTNLPARGSIGSGSRAGGPLVAGEWAVALGKDVLQALLTRQLAREEAKVGRAPLLLDLRGLTLGERGLDLDLRVWSRGRLAWWKDYSIHGALAIDQGRLAARVESLTPGEGGGMDWLAERRGKAWDPTSQPIQAVVDLSNASWLWLSDAEEGISPSLSRIQLGEDRLTLVGTLSR